MAKAKDLKITPKDPSEGLFNRVYNSILESGWIGTQHLNGTPEIANYFGITVDNLHKWRNNGVPLKHIIKVAELTGIPEESWLIDSFAITKFNNEN